jgi:hypothetical protein
MPFENDALFKKTGGLITRVPVLSHSENFWTPLYPLRVGLEPFVLDLNRSDEPRSADSQLGKCIHACKVGALRGGWKPCGSRRMR